MWFDIFLRGVIVGLAASMPAVGPVGVLCIQRTLSRGQKSGFISGLGAATADTIYATIAFFSLSFVEDLIVANQHWIKIIVSLCIIGMGIFIFFRNPVLQIRRGRAGKSSMWKDFLSIFGLTIANPGITLVFVALLAALGLSDEGGQWNGIPTLTGVLAGAAGWWLLITMIVNIFRKKFRPRHLLWINRIGGIIVCVCGLFVIISTVFNLSLNFLVGK